MRNQDGADYTDIRSSHWTLRLLPKAAEPYGLMARIDRPIGWQLLLLPCWWSAAIAWTTQDSMVSWTKLAWYFLLFFLGAVIMRSAGCVINDLWDRKIDGKVERTRSRPLPAGDVTPLQALIFLGVLCLMGLLILLQFNWVTVGWGVASLGLVILYPLAKRVTYWPQMVLGLAFNWGALLGWTAIQGTIHPAALCLYVAGVVWTLTYDTVYAHQDKMDDIKVGVKSTALKFGDKTLKWLSFFTAVQFFAFLAAGFFAGANWVWYAASIAAVIWIFWLLFHVDFDEPKDCLRLFKAQWWVGLVLVLGALFA